LIGFGGIGGGTFLVIGAEDLLHSAYSDSDSSSEDDSYTSSSSNSEPPVSGIELVELVGGASAGKDSSKN